MVLQRRGTCLDSAGPLGLLQVADRHQLVHLGTVIQDSAGGVVIVLTAIVLAHRLRTATAAQRRTLVALYAYGIAAILLLEVAVHLLPALFGFDPITVFVFQISVAAGIPIAFVAGVLRGGFARAGEIEELRAWFEIEHRERLHYRDALASALGDDSIELLFWLPERASYVNASGVEATLPEVGSGRGAVEIELAGTRLGAIEYDALLIGEAKLVRDAGRVISLALDRERLTEELTSSRKALRESRARIISAADRERDRIARDLHDGLQAQLVLLSISAGRIAADPTAAGTAEEALRLRFGLEAAGAELRRLVQGVMPALLIERGLYAATENLVDRMPVPTRLELTSPELVLPEGVQRAGYFVVAEALTTAVKPSRARELAVNLGRDRGHLRSGWATTASGGPVPATARMRGSRTAWNRSVGGCSSAVRPERDRRRQLPMRDVIVKDAALMCEGLVHVLQDTRIEVVGVTGEAPGLVRLAAAHAPDLVLTDIRMPPGHTDDGLRAALEIRRRQPEIAIMILSQYVRRRYALELLEDTFMDVGYLLKQRVADGETFARDIRRVAAGGTVLDPEVVSVMVARARRDGDAIDRLTPRQTEVLG